MSALTFVNHSDLTWSHADKCTDHVKTTDMLATLGVWALALVLTFKNGTRPLGIGVLVGSFVLAVSVAGFLVRYGLDIGTTT